jgi:hypothetical protein
VFKDFRAVAVEVFAELQSAAGIVDEMDELAFASFDWR